MYRSLFLVLAVLSGSAMADGHHARDCAQAVSKLDEKQAFVRAIDPNMTIEAITISDDRLERWVECQRARESVEHIARMRAEVEAERLRLARLLGRQLPGSGYHIVHFADGRTVGSARVTVYRDGRSIAVSR